MWYYLYNAEKYPCDIFDFPSSYEADGQMRNQHYTSTGDSLQYLLLTLHSDIPTNFKYI